MFKPILEQKMRNLEGLHVSRSLANRDSALITYDMHVLKASILPNTTWKAAALNIE